MKKLRQKVEMKKPRKIQYGVIFSGNIVYLTAEEFRKVKNLDRFFCVKIDEYGKGTPLFTGDFVFKMYDTYGFPLDLLKLRAKESGFEVDEIGFNIKMNRQRERSRNYGV